MDTLTRRDSAPPGVKVTLGGRALRTFSNIASISSSSGGVEDRANLILEQVQSLVPYRGVLLARTHPSQTAPQRVATSGYSNRLVDYMLSTSFRSELLEPFAATIGKWPMRECDMPMDPLTLRPIAEHLRPEGFLEGMVMTLPAREGGIAGFLILSVEDQRPPSDESVTVLAHAAGLLGNLIDPLRDARWLTSILSDDQTAVAILPNKRLVALRGEVVPDLERPESGLRKALAWAEANHRIDVPFIWLDSAGTWFSCRLLRCAGGVMVVTISESARVYGLTRRELEVLTHLSLGRTNDEIATALVVTTRTVRAHVERLMDKLNTGSRSGVASRAIHEGLTMPAILEH